ncbi:hypothetical protein [Enterococcus phage vB_EfaS_EF1c55]|nr:hypothetical protein [Enterococcus phage vB_EfaS_EF1c55]
MNESIYSDIPEFDLKPEIYGVVINFYCNKCQKPIVMRLDEPSLVALDGVYQGRLAEDSNVILEDCVSGYRVALDLQDVVTYASKKLDKEDFDFSWRTFTDWVDTFTDNEGGD